MVPIDLLRVEVESLCRANLKLWDGRVAQLEVTDVRNGLELRALVSASNSQDAWNLRCVLREHIINYLKENFPDALPRIRILVKSWDG